MPVITVSPPTAAQPQTCVENQRKAELTLHPSFRKDEQTVLRRSRHGRCYGPVHGHHCWILGTLEFVAVRWQPVAVRDAPQQWTRAHSKKQLE